MPAALFDVLIVGSGPSGTHAALEAVASGRRVGMIDVGQAASPPSPDSREMMRGADSIFPIESRTFFPMQATTLGGLGAAWGGNCFVLSSRDLDRMGLPPAEMPRHYLAAVREIGAEPAGVLDRGASRLLSAFRAEEGAHRDEGFALGPSLLAAQTQNGHALDVYRPRVTLDRLTRHENFTLLDGRLATSFEEHGDVVTLHTRTRDGGSVEQFSGRTLLLAGGAINSARLALVSLGLTAARQPLLCTRNHWIAAVHLRMLGRRSAERSTLSQLTVVMGTEAIGDVVAQIYGPGLLNRLTAQVPPQVRIARPFLAIAGGALMFINVHFEDRPSSRRWLSLETRPGGPVLRAETEFTPQETAIVTKEQRRLSAWLSQRRCIPVTIKVAPHGAGVHYAGTLPYSSDDAPGTTKMSDVLAGTTRVYVADGSSWKVLPAQGPTLTLMANARRVAANAMRAL
jgi:hypothetical protein